MQNAFKQFGEKATDSFSRRFSYSLWKLTGIYVLILAVILAISSSIIYSAFSQQLDRRYRGMRPIPPEFINIVSPQPSREDLKRDLIQAIIAVNSLLLMSAGIFSYWLAKRTLRPLQDSFEEQQRFLADASHELRTPLSILKTELENELHSPAVSAGDRHRVESKLEEVDRMSRLVADLLALSRLSEEGTSQSVRTSLSVPALVTAAVERLQPLAEQQRVTLKAVLSAQDILITSNKDLLLQAISNVIKNGLLYNKPQGLVDVIVSTSHGAVQVIVRDTGVGMAADELSKVFDRFYRAEKSRSRSTGGNGLGLPIVRSIIESLGGEVTIESEVDKGTTVTLTLPLV